MATLPNTEPGLPENEADPPIPELAWMTEPKHAVFPETLPAATVSVTDTSTANPPPCLARLSSTTAPEFTSTLPVVSA